MKHFQLLIFNFQLFAAAMLFAVVAQAQAMDEAWQQAAVVEKNIAVLC